MTEYTIHLHDENGTGYGHMDLDDNEIIYEDLNEARMAAKSQLGGGIVLTRVIDRHTHRVVDFFEVE